MQLSSPLLITLIVIITPRVHWFVNWIPSESHVFNLSTRRCHDGDRNKRDIEIAKSDIAPTAKSTIEQPHLRTPPTERVTWSETTHHSSHVTRQPKSQLNPTNVFSTWSAKRIHLALSITKLFTFIQWTWSSPHLALHSFRAVQTSNVLVAMVARTHFEIVSSNHHVIPLAGDNILSNDPDEELDARRWVSR